MGCTAEGSPSDAERRFAQAVAAFAAAAAGAVSRDTPDTPQSLAARWAIDLAAARTLELQRSGADPSDGEAYLRTAEALEAAAEVLAEHKPQPWVLRIPARRDATRVSS